MCRHTTICVHILRTHTTTGDYETQCRHALEERRILHICPHTTIYVSSYFTCVLILLHCILILLYMCFHTTMCPHTTKHVSLYYYMCPSMCPHTTMHYYYRALWDVSSYYYMCVLVCVLILLCTTTTGHYGVRRLHAFEE
jgi:hypothetical protein